MTTDARLPAIIARSEARDARPAELAVPRPMRAAAAWSWRLLAIAAAVVLIGSLVVVFQLVVVSFIIALLLAVLLDPVSSFLRKRLRFPAALASITTIIAVLAFIAGLLALTGRAMIMGFSDLADRAVQGFNQAINWLSEGPLAIAPEQIQNWIDEGITQLQQNAGTLASGAVAATSTLTQVIAGALIALFCLFFFLKDGRRIWQWFVRLTPVRSRNPINEAGIRGWLTLGGYVRAQILVAFVDGVGIGLGAYFLGVPLALPLGVLVFLGAFIPIIGALVTGSVAVLVALVDQGFGTAIWMLIIVLLVQQIEGNVLQPWLLGSAVSLHPVAVLLAVTAGTGLAGILGALLAVPIAAVINAVVLYLNGHDKHPQAATDWHRPGGPPGVLFREIEDGYGDTRGEDEEDGDDFAVESATVGGQDGGSRQPGDSSEGPDDPPERPAP